ncbi:MAG: glycosyltransferase, partial [Chloroflexi bacterium]|nr:glycosyltransferase [Chloroflexota bacterium]
HAHPEAILYLHTEPRGHVHGMDVLAAAEALGLQGAVKTCDPYNYLLSFPRGHMAELYSAMDVLLNPAYGEGFGIPLLEAQACGTPVIATDWTAMSELIGPGWAVEGDRWWSEQSSWQKVPAVEGIAEALEAAYDDAAARRAAAREFAVSYDHRAVYQQHWRPALADLETQLRPAEAIAA